mgnify:FL=1
MKFHTINPATEEVLLEYNLMSKEEALAVAEKSNNAFNKWKNLAISERAKFFKNLAKVLRDNKQEYAEIMTKEMGKPITESLAEVEKCAYLAEVLIENAEKWLADEEANADGKKHIITFEPLGAIYIILPWNFPFWQPFKVGLPPLIAGNTIIFKHAGNVTGSALKIEEAFKKAGFPEDIFRAVIVDHETSSEIIESKYVKACSLTGSVGAGASIAQKSGANIKKIVLELGGSDPFIVLEDADIQAAAKGAVLGRTRNAGQVCIGSKRIIVHKKIAEEFTKKFSEMMEQLIVGDPMNPKTQVGPLVNEKAAQDMENFVKDAVSKGAVISAGGKKIKSKGYYFEPTVLTNVNEDMNVACNEVFGPVAPVIIAKNEEDAIKIANNSEFGLSASLWTNDLAKGERLARKLETGSVFINSISKSHALLPIGGIKKSGFGRELSHYGIREFVNVKGINIYEHKK